MGEYEAYLRALDAFREYTDRAATDRNEATTRLQLIDRLFFGCLGWSTDAVVLEQPHGGEFADYVFGANHLSLVVEAKREGIYFEVPAGISRVEMSIPALLRGNDALANAIDQVSGYCQRRGIPLGAVSNGRQLVCLVANRTDGVPPSMGRALVFSSPQAMVDYALDLWNALSPAGVEAKTLQRRLLGDGGQQLPQKLSSSIGDYPGIKGRNVFQTELQIVSEGVLEDVARHRDFEATFLRECYCQSGALSQYALISKELFQARYASLFGTDSPGPTVVPISTRGGISSDLISDSVATRPVLIIGDVGVGKTSFIRNLMKVEAATTFETAIGLYLDLGTQATLTKDARAFVLEEISTPATGRLQR